MLHRAHASQAAQPSDEDAARPRHVEVQGADLAASSSAANGDDGTPPKRSVVTSRVTSVLCSCRRCV